ncbi:MAG: DNA polymerase III subunit gamma/tau, partial [Candidatus Pacebacteria bacterium]|nr:DNA polymerase III subunit gamma/tau [Candidatus Paceibacterota bacterium]
MSNIVLYRKHRPQTFSEVIGQEHVVQTITNAISANQISHAYLFSGPRGSGKTSMARLLAKAASCENRRENQFEPCNQCSSCVDINRKRSVDLIEIDAASHRGIDDIRELRSGVRFAPIKSKYKTFIIDECHQLTTAASNALLKTLEEPPSHAIFILATTEAHKMISTIISRCQRFDFKKLTVPEIAKKIEIIIKLEKIKVEKQAINLIAKNARGSIRDAESFLDQAITFCGKREIKAEDIKDLLGLVEIEQIFEFTNFIVNKKTAEAINFLEQITDKGQDLQEFIKSFINYLREGLVLKIDPDKNSENMEFTKEEVETLKEQLKQTEQIKILKTIETFLDALNKMKYSPIPQLSIELAIIEVC